MAKRRRKPLRIPRGFPGAGQFAPRELIEQLRLEKYFAAHPFRPKPKPRKRPVETKSPKRRVPRGFRGAGRYMSQAQIDSLRLERVADDVAAMGYTLREETPWEVIQFEGLGRVVWLSFRLWFGERYEVSDMIRWAQSFEFWLDNHPEYHLKCVATAFVEYVDRDGPINTGWRSFVAVTSPRAIAGHVEDEIRRGEWENMQRRNSRMVVSVLGFAIDLRLTP